MWLWAHEHLRLLTAATFQAIRTSEQTTCLEVVPETTSGSCTSTLFSKYGNGLGWACSEVDLFASLVNAQCALWFSLRAQDEPPLDRSFCAPVARCSLVCISTAVLRSPTASLRENRRVVNHIDSPRSPRGSVVCGDDSNVDCAVMANSTSRGRDVSGGRHDRAIASNRPATGGLAPERDRLERSGLSDSVIRTIQGSRASFTSRWNVFSQWCAKENVDPVCCQG